MSKQNDRRELLTEAEAAEYLRLAVKTLQGWRYRRRGPVFARLGGRVVYDRTDLNAYIDANKRATD